jgi:hypothetical protein
MRSWRSYAHEVLCLRHLVSKWLGIAVNKKRKIPGFPTFFKLGVGSTQVDRHRVDADPDPDLDRHQNGIQDSDRSTTLLECIDGLFH